LRGLRGVSTSGFVELLKQLKERLLEYCNHRLKRDNPSRCLILYNDMKNFFYELKNLDDPEYLKLYKENLDPILRFILLKHGRNTFKTYFKILYPYAKYLIRNKIHIFRVNHEVLNRYFIDELKAQYKSENTLHLVNTVLRIFYHQYGRREIVDMLRRIRFKRSLKFKVDLTDEEYEKIFKAADDLRVKLALELIAGSGLRPAEALGITWADVDISNKPWRVHVRYVKNSPYGAKGESGERTVPITTRAAKLINILRGIYARKYVYDPIQNKEYSRIINISYRTLVRKFNKAVEKAGVRKRYPLTLHKLRHYFGHRWMKINKDVVKLKAILGHSKFDYTLVYTNPTEEEIVDSFRNIDRE